jgi:hypothetical protein
MTPAERITLWLATMRASSRAAVLSRALVGAAGVVAILLPASRPWDQLDVVPVVALPLLVASLVLPDSAAALLFLAVVSGGWLLRAPGGVGWDVVLTGIALLAVHLGSAFAAQIPSYAKVERRSLRRWLLPTTAAVVLGPVVAVATALVRGADVPGSLVLTVAALAAVTGSVWFAAGQSLTDR